MMRLLLALTVIGLLFSCKQSDEKGIYDEGRIEYKITYLNAEEGNYDPSFLPKKMILQFNQDYSINRIDGFMGFFKLGNMTYFKNKKVRTHLKVLDKNYAFMGGRNEMMCCFDCMEGMMLTEDTATYNIAGLESKKIFVSFSDGREPFDIYYTKDINLEHPNISNPYAGVDGVLTGFRLMMGPYLMQFRAIKFDPAKAPQEEMSIPSEAMVVDRNQMVAILNRLMEQNM